MEKDIVPPGEEDCIDQIAVVNVDYEEMEMEKQDYSFPATYPDYCTHSWLGDTGHFKHLYLLTDQAEGSRFYSSDKTGSRERERSESRYSAYRNRRTYSESARSESSKHLESTQRCDPNSYNSYFPSRYHRTSRSADVEEILPPGVNSLSRSSTERRSKGRDRDRKHSRTEQNDRYSRRHSTRDHRDHNKYREKFRTATDRESSTDTGIEGKTSTVVEEITISSEDEVVQVHSRRSRSRSRSNSNISRYSTSRIRDQSSIFCDRFGEGSQYEEERNSLHPRDLRNKIEISEARRDSYSRGNSPYYSSSYEAGYSSHYDERDRGYSYDRHRDYRDYSMRRRRDFEEIERERRRNEEERRQCEMEIRRLKEERCRVESQRRYAEENCWLEKSEDFLRKLGVPEQNSEKYDRLPGHSEEHHWENREYIQRYNSLPSTSSAPATITSNQWNQSSRRSPSRDLMAKQFHRNNDTLFSEVSYRDEQGPRSQSAFNQHESRVPSLVPQRDEIDQDLIHSSASIGKTEILKPGNYLEVMFDMLTLGSGLTAESYQIGAFSSLGDFLSCCIRPKFQLKRAQCHKDMPLKKFNGNMGIYNFQAKAFEKMIPEQEAVDLFLSFLEKNKNRTRPAYDGIVLISFDKTSIRGLMRVLNKYRLIERFFRVVSSIGHVSNLLDEKKMFSNLPKHSRDSNEMLNIAYKQLFDKTIESEKMLCQIKANHVYQILLPLLSAEPNYQNFFQVYTFPTTSSELERIANAKTDSEKYQFYLPMEKFICGHLEDRLRHSDDIELEDQNCRESSKKMCDRLISAGLDFESLLDLAKRRGIQEFELYVRSVLLQTMAGQTRNVISQTVQTTKLVVQYFQENVDKSLEDIVEEAVDIIRTENKEEYEDPIVSAVDQRIRDLLLYDNVQDYIARHISQNICAMKKKDQTGYTLVSEMRRIKMTVDEGFHLYSLCQFKKDTFCRALKARLRRLNNDTFMFSIPALLHYYSEEYTKPSSQDVE